MIQIIGTNSLFQSHEPLENSKKSKLKNVVYSKSSLGVNPRVINPDLNNLKFIDSPDFKLEKLYLGTIY